MVSLADLKAWLSIDASVSTFDDLLTSLEARAVAFVQQQTGRYFGAVGPITEILPGSGCRDLWLREPPTTDPTSVVETSYPGAPNPVTILASDIDGFEVRELDSEGRLTRKGGHVWHRGYEYAVSYERGYAAGSEPGDIRQLVTDLVALKFQLRDNAGGALEGETIGGYAYRMGDFSQMDLDAIPMAEETLASWRRMNV